jgi:hypothetical protein
VYYPISENPLAPDVVTFDQALDRHITRKRDLARDFLHPSSLEDAGAEELRSELLESSGIGSESQRILDRSAINSLSPSDFEALVAATYDGQIGRAILTPRVGDAGADVVLVRERGGVLIQAKHHPRGDATLDGIGDLLAALDAYAPRLGGVWAPTVVTSGRFSREAMREASSRGVELVNGDSFSELVRRRAIGYREVFAASSRRVSNFESVIAMARSIMV